MSGNEQFKWSRSRRRLLVWTGGAFSAMAALLGGDRVIARAQSKPTPSKPMDTPSKTFRILVGPANLLDKNGKVLTGTALIVRNTATKTLIGVSPVCTHKGCIVDWNQRKQRFVCPCHGAEFDPSGKVKAGPAQTDLIGYEVKVENNTYLIK